MLSYCNLICGSIWCYFWVKAVCFQVKSWCECIELHFLSKLSFQKRFHECLQIRACSTLLLLFRARCCWRSTRSCACVKSGLSSRLFQAGAKVIGEAVWKGNGANPHGNQRELIRISHAEPVHPRADKHWLQHSGVNLRA